MKTLNEFTMEDSTNTTVSICPTSSLCITMTTFVYYCLLTLFHHMHVSTSCYLLLWVVQEINVGTDFLVCVNDAMSCYSLIVNKLANIRGYTPLPKKLRKNQIKTHKRLKMNAFSYRQDKTMCEFSAYFAFNNGQTYIKHQQESTLIWMSLLRIAVEKSSLPPHLSFRVC